MKNDGIAAKALFDIANGKVPFDLAVARSSSSTLAPREQRYMSNKLVPVIVGILFASGFGVAKATQAPESPAAMSAMGP